jgi:histidyl-tRNA synthetase
LGAQGTVCAGGRYDGLVEQLGGKGTPAVGFAMGLERIELLLQQKEKLENAPDVYVILNSEEVGAKATTKLMMVEKLRSQFPLLKIEVDMVETGNPFKRGENRGAKQVLNIKGKTMEELVDFISRTIC